MVSVTDPAGQTLAFTIAFLALLLLTVRKKPSKRLFPKSLTEELKGAAMLMVVFSHIGYLLASNERFLWPYSIMAGVGVNLFLFMSGYGLTISQFKKSLSVIQFYTTRLFRLLLPLWIVLVALFLLDAAFLGRFYSPEYIFKSFLGIFTSADANTDVNSVLWFLTFLILYYLLFPIVFMKKRIWLSALLLLVASYLLVRRDPHWLDSVLRLYKVHYAAFPLGVLFGGLVAGGQLKRFKENRLQKPLERIGNWTHTHYLKTGLYLFSLAVLSLIVIYTAVNSGVDDLPIKEQLISLACMAAFVGFFIIKRFEVRFISLFGLYSYEIYLLHWPLVSRYDFLYSQLQPWLATFLYLGVFIGLAWLIQKISTRLISLLPER